MALSEASNQAFWYQSFMGELCFSVEDLYRCIVTTRVLWDLAVNPSQAADQAHPD